MTARRAAPAPAGSRVAARVAAAGLAVLLAAAGCGGHRGGEAPGPAAPADPNQLVDDAESLAGQVESQIAEDGTG